MFDMDSFTDKSDILCKFKMAVIVEGRDKVLVEAKIL